MKKANRPGIKQFIGYVIHDIQMDIDDNLILTLVEPESQEQRVLVAYNPNDLVERRQVTRTVTEFVDEPLL
jgi:hypothetical protein